MKSRLVLFALFTTSMVLVLFAATLAQSQGSVGTVSYVQENGRRVEGLVSVDGYSVTVTLKDPSGAIKSTRTTWPSSGLRYIVNLTATIRPSDTLEVAAGGVTTLIFVDPLSAQLDPDHDQVTGLGPAGEAVALDLKLYDEWGMAETYTGTAHVDANGSFTASSFYLDGVGPQAVDIQPGDNGTLRYTHADGNQVTLNFGQIIYVHQDTNQVHGYAALHSVPVSVILYAPGGSVKAEASTTSSSLGAGSYSVYLYTPGWPRQPVPVRGGDTVVVDIEGVTTTVAVDLLTATPDLSSDTVSGFGPPNSSLKLTLHGCHDGWSDELDCPQWVTTDGAGDYSAGPFLYHTREISGGSSVWVTRTCDIVAGTTGQVNYISPDFNVNSISYGAPQVKVQENARRVEGVVAVNGYSVTVTLKDPSGAVKSTRTTWSSTGLRYLVNLTATIRPSDTVEVSSGGATTLVFVEPLAARLDPDNDRVTGLGPANEAVPIELRTYDEVGMASTYTSTANVDAHGLFTVSTFYRYGSGPQAVDIQPGDNGTLRYTNADGNQVTLNFGQIVY
ncbi:MAG: hypothetical protein JW850_07635, partial [Thermoflexales bacterium]|nr:hypothetical protein [Thermoflexales bacterium]